MQRRRLIVGRGALLRKVAAARLLVVEAQREVAPVGQVVNRLERGPQRGHFEEVDDMPFLHTVELAATVVAVDREDLPAVFVNI